MTGKFLHRGEAKWFARGVTYGTFQPDHTGVEFPSRAVVIDDLTAMARNGINCLRTYTVPPGWLLDEAHARGLGVMIGIPVERYVGYLTDRDDAPDVAEIVRRGVGETAGHPAAVCYTIGNEIPAGTVRWHGRRKMERHLERLYRAAKREHPAAIVTYANYPSTEYLQLDFLDLVCFNVFLEATDQLAPYLARLQNIAGNRPLIIGELGLDGLRNGERTQARSLGEQISTTFTEGCAGVFTFAWTDEWHTGGGDVSDWQFGLTRRDRSPKAALGAVRDAFTRVPFREGQVWPKITIVVCTYNGADRIDECLRGIAGLDYPDFETIVVDNGSTDDTSAVAAAHPGVTVIRTPPTGLGDARNVGLQAAAGEIVAYIDDDASPDTHWLRYLAHTFMTTDVSGVGGPNIPPAHGGFVSQCIRRAPGNPVHVLMSDREAEHIAGCNMAFRKEALADVGGFDPRFRVAGDDVDICWQMRDSGRTLGFSPAAMVWHHPRSTIASFWRQQLGYGRAEGLLESKWPDRYNGVGQTRWNGRIYGGVAAVLQRAGRVYHGLWGTAPFQRLYADPPGMFASLAGIPEWYLVMFVLLTASLLAVIWPVLTVVVPVLVAAIALTLGQAVRGALRVPLDGGWSSPRTRAGMRTVIAVLHLLQPIARMWGRAQSGLTPWRRPPRVGLAPPVVRKTSLWSEEWRAPEEWLSGIEQDLRDAGAVVGRGGDFDRHDLEIRGGIAGAVRVLVAVEEHGRGRQLVRTKAWPHLGAVPAATLVLGALSAAGAGMVGAAAGGVVLALATAVLAGRALWECAAAAGAARAAIEGEVRGVVVERASPAA